MLLSQAADLGADLIVMGAYGHTRFQEIVLGNTERALSIASFDTGEDTKLDKDIVLGTHYVGGTNDVLVWWNKRANSTTPNSSLFSNTADYARVIAADVNAVLVPDLNGDGYSDLVTGLGSSFNNIAVWLMQTSNVNRGQLPLVPTAFYTASGAMAVTDIAPGFIAVPLPVADGPTRTHVEVWVEC